jgi:hypothetical protein
MTRPEATIQAVATNRVAFFDRVFRHSRDVKKPLPPDFDDRHDVVSQRQTQMRDAQPCHDQLYLEASKVRGYTQQTSG